MKKSVLMLLTAASLLAAMPVQATRQAQERQIGRDVRQDNRSDSRTVKQYCREGVFGNAECRQDHRGNKQNGREKARKIKYGPTAVPA